MLPQPPASTVFPYTTLFRSDHPLPLEVLPQVGQCHVLLFQRRLKVFFDVDLVVDRKSTRLNSSHVKISYAVFCLKKKIILDKIAKQTFLASEIVNSLLNFSR